MQEELYEKHAHKLLGGKEAQTSSDKDTKDEKAKHDKGKGKGSGKGQEQGQSKEKEDEGKGKGKGKGKAGEFAKKNKKYTTRKWQEIIRRRLRKKSLPLLPHASGQSV